jgi:hypothetical protein
MLARKGEKMNFRIQKSRSTLNWVAGVASKCLPPDSIDQSQATVTMVVTMAEFQFCKKKEDTLYPVPTPKKVKKPKLNKKIQQ